MTRRSKKAKKLEVPNAELTMSEQLKLARQKYTSSKSSNGNLSVHNGDDVATLLAGNAPEIVCATAEKLSNLKKGSLTKKYGHLNPGQARMCAGNRIRAMVKRKEVTVDEVAAILAAL